MLGAVEVLVILLIGFMDELDELVKLLCLESCFRWRVTFIGLSVFWTVAKLLVTYYVCMACYFILFHFVYFYYNIIVWIMLGLLSDFFCGGRGIWGVGVLGILMFGNPSGTYFGFWRFGKLLFWGFDI